MCFSKSTISNVFSQAANEVAVVTSMALNVADFRYTSKPAADAG
jgi:hypothetical protein